MMSTAVILKYVLYSFLIAFSMIIASKMKKLLLYKYDISVLAIFFGIIIHSIFLSTDPSYSLERALFSTLALIMIIMLRTILGIKIIKYSETILILVMFFIVISSLVGLIIYRGGGPMFFEGNFRGFFRNSNNIGMISAVLIFPFALTLITRQTNKSMKYLYVFMAAALVVIMLMSRSRASIGVALIELIIFMYLHGMLKNGRWVLYVWGAVFIGLIFSPIIMETVVNKYTSNTEGVFSTRTIMWVHRLYGISLEPVFGSGFLVNPAEVLFTETYTFNLLEKGNVYLALIEEFGFTYGPVIIIWLIYSVWRSRKVHLSNIYIYLSLIGMLAHSMLETWVFNFNSWVALYIWMYILNTDMAKQPQSISTMNIKNIILPHSSTQTSVKK